MDNQLLSTPSEGLSSPQGNTTNSGNITNNHYRYREDTYSSQNYAEILRCRYTSAYGSHRNRTREPARGTCTWVTEHPKYTDWLRGDTSGLLWLSADPGCGKSVIASFLITHLKPRTEAIVCYFFFKDDSDEQRRATFALCAILHQLFSERRELCLYAQRQFETRGRRFTEEVDTLWNILVEAVTEGGCGNVICVVDALDECEEGTLAQLVRHLTSLSRPQGPRIALKIVVTSRPYLKIERGLASHPATIRLKGEDEVNAITADVTRAIDDTITELESFWENPGGLGYLRRLLLSSADRTFLWVSLVLEILKDSPGGSREEFTNIVSSAPRDLAEFYTRILDKSTNPDKARLILHTVVAAARPLTVEETDIALTVRRDHTSMRGLQGDLYPVPERSVKNLCGLFVRVIDSKIYLVHQTAREFLIKGSSPGEGNWQYTLCPQDSNLVLANICISYLLLEDVGNDPLAIGTPTRTTRHVEHTGRMELFEPARLICERGSNRFLTWLKVYWEPQIPSLPFPHDFTHLMIASWLGHGTVVERLLEEGGGINARSQLYSTALNVAALRKDESITRALVESNAHAYLCGREYNILHVKMPSCMK
ncbi:hypothetical protein C7212DRAFT_353589 [Tuber magnatum]|uniref:Uncharacterized protein n=1 Tax=Tuber magnatum TaxID=42249 RepID=A0A317SHX1_9PEZI|nr:hypothetical protein C7212DRAFT_353589 [Tuber magnatum]